MKRPKIPFAFILLPVLGLASCATGSPASEDGPRAEQPTDPGPAAEAQSDDGEPVEQRDSPERSTDPTAKVEAADAAKIECERIRATPSDQEHLSLEDLATEGGSAVISRIDDEIVRARGGLLFEVSRFRFDYIYRDGQLLCAEETVSNVNVMSEGTGNWEYFWHHQHLVFDGDTVLSTNHEYTDGAEGRGHDSYEMRQLADSVLARAAGSPDSGADTAEEGAESRDSGEPESLRELCIERLAEGGCCDPEEDPPPDAKMCVNGAWPMRRK